jgi:hypothetical protein
VAEEQADGNLTSDAVDSFIESLTDKGVVLDYDEVRRLSWEWLAEAPEIALERIRWATRVVNDLGRERAEASEQPG